MSSSLVCASSSRRVLAAWICFALVFATILFASDFSGRWDSDEALGVRVWRERNCVACHSIYGLGGHIGPDLTNTTRRRGAAYVQHVLREGTTRMADLDLSEEEIAALIGYLEEIDRLGEYPIKAPSGKSFGNNS